jgi:hypothetical protein
MTNNTTPKITQKTVPLVGETWLLKVKSVASEIFNSAIEIILCPTFSFSFFAFNFLQWHPET